MSDRQGGRERGRGKREGVKERERGGGGREAGRECVRVSVCAGWWPSFLT